MKRIASVSFGKDSLAMLLRLLEEDWPLDEVVFYNTGMEFQAIYDIRDKIKPILEKRGIHFSELHPSEPFLYSMFDRKVKYRNKEGYHYGYSWCGGPCRWGTHDKLKVIAKHKRDMQDTVIDYVGIAADETRRFEQAKSEGKMLPLAEWGMTEADCLQYCYDRDFTWEEQTANGPVRLYDILDRVSCWCCCNKNLKELRNIMLYLPEYWERLKDLQRRAERPMKGTGKSVFDLEARFRKEL